LPKTSAMKPMRRLPKIHSLEMNTAMKLQAALDTLTDYEEVSLLLKTCQWIIFQGKYQNSKKKEPALRKQFQLQN
jgi:hypothetical protein